MSTSKHKCISGGSIKVLHDPAWMKNITRHPDTPKWKKGGWGVWVVMISIFNLQINMDGVVF